MAEADRVDRLEARLADLEAMVRFAPVGLCLVDRELRFVHINERLAAINGKPAAQHIGRSVAEVIPAIEGQVTPVFRRILETGEPVCDVVVRGRLPSDPNHEHTWLANYHPLRDDARVVSGIVGVVVDVTELMATHAELAAVKERLSDAQRVARVGSWEWDILNDRVWWSDELFHLVRKDKGGFTPSLDSFYELLHPEDRPAFRRQLEAVLQRAEPFVEEFRLVLDDGEVRTFHNSAVIERAADGMPARLIGTIQDITERRKAEAARVQAALD